MKSIISGLTVIILILAVSERIGAETKQCYVCEQVDDPVWSDCWNATDDLPTVECENSCFVSMFQSGGNVFDNYWNVKRGCTSECSPSQNCKSQHYGACEYCCGSNLCNTYVAGSAVTVRISVVLSLVSLLVAYIGK